MRTSLCFVQLDGRVQSRETFERVDDKRRRVIDEVFL